MKEKIAKFGIVGIIATLIDFALFTILVKNPVYAVNPVYATAISFTISLVINYILSIKYVFIDKKQMSKTFEFVGFAITAIIGLGINVAIMWIATEILQLNGIYWNWFWKAFATGVVMVWNFLARQYFLEKDVKWISKLEKILTRK